MTERVKRLSRRNFLLAAGAGAATAVAAKSGKPPVSPGETKRAARGYHASEHVNNYYRTTKV